MRQWNGLLRKEWVSMKWTMYTVIVCSVLFISLVPIAITRANAAGIDEFYHIGLVLGLPWAVMSTLVPIMILFTSLEREMKTTDLWLHSSTSIFKIIGAKVFFALSVGIVGFLVPSIFIAMQYNFDGLQSFKEIISSGSIVFITLLMHAGLIIGAGLFFWVLYQVLKPYLKVLSIPVVIFLYLFLSELYRKMKLTSFYESFAHTGVLNHQWIDVFKIKVSIHNDIEKAPFYAGELLFNLSFPFVLFLVAAALFEKKVRL